MIRKMLFDSDRQLRNGWWIALFFAALGAMLVATSLQLQSNGVVPVEYQLLMVLGLTWALQSMRRRPVSEVLGPFNAASAKHFLVGSVAGVLLMGVAALFLWLGGWVRFEWTAAGTSALLPGLVLLLPAAVLEELVFRGFLFRRLQAGLGVGAAILITSAFFLLTHLGNPGMTGVSKVLASINIFIASLMFSWALLRSGGLAMPIGLHLAANFTQSTVLGFGVSGETLPGMLAPQFVSDATWLTGGQFGLEASLPGLLAVCVLTLLLYRYRAGQT